MKQEMMGWQWHQLDHMQIICTSSLHTDNHASTLSVSFYKPDALPDVQPAASNHCSAGTDHRLTAAAAAHLELMKLKT